MQNDTIGRMLQALKDPDRHLEALRDFDGHPPEFQAAVIAAVPEGEVLRGEEVRLIGSLCRRAKVASCEAGILMQYFARMLLAAAIDHREAHYPSLQTVRAMAESCLISASESKISARADSSRKQEKPIPIAPLGLACW